MSDIVILSGSPSEYSRSEYILKYMGTLLKERSCNVTHLSVRDVPQTDLFTGRHDSEDIQDIVDRIKRAQGIIVGSPVYKASYSGILKTLIDLFPQDVLEHTPVLPVMTGGSESHLLAIEYTLKPLLATLKGQNLKGLYYLDKQIDREQERPIIDERLLERTENQLQYLIDKVNQQKSRLSSSL